ncbi:hypothetical protein [Streptomyces sp. NPDC051546]|uniref:hypothetical protein n=1 Tax=Streptomyces sp. NPDC051546 TaxID=3365655 RepID=UPI00378E7D55
MTNAERRAVDQAVKAYMAEHPGTRQVVARRIVESTTPVGEAKPVDPRPVQPESAGVIAKAAEVLTMPFQQIRRGCEGKTSATFDLRAGLALYGSDAVLIDLDGPSSLSSARNGEYDLIFTDWPPSPGRITVDGVDEEKLLRLLGSAMGSGKSHFPPQEQ